jgi:hypothetical protein
MAGRLRIKIRTWLEDRDAAKGKRRAERRAKEATGRHDEPNTAQPGRQPPGDRGGGAGAT